MIGKHISSYIIKEKLGAGGMGEVYHAEDTRLGRHVALKFLPDEVARKKHAVERFLREARAASALNHPNICTIYDIGEFEERPFIVMELLEGKPLQDVIRGRALPVLEVLELGIQIADGLEAAHSRGIVHRDIKPGNLHVSEKGHVKILDFGLAKLRLDEQYAAPQQSRLPTEAAHLTTSGTTVGTIAYMSPEQSRGREVDARTDIFSFGAMMYEMATGKQAFPGNSAAEVFDAILNQQPASPVRVNPELPDELERILMKMLEKDPDLRYQSAAEVRSDIKRLLRDLSSGSSLTTDRVHVPTAASSTTARNGALASGSDADIAMSLIGRHRKAVFGGLAVVILILAALFYTTYRRESTTQESGKHDSVAVMYFENVTDASDSDNTARMLSNLLTTELSRTRDLNVVSSQRLYDIAKQMNQGEGPINRSVATAVADRAKVSTMVLGQVARVGTRLVATTELVEVSSGRVLGSQKAEGRTAEDIFAMAEELGAQVRKNIPQVANSQTLEKSLAGQLTTSVEAYRSYIRGESYLNRQQFPRAAEEFRRAVEVDPTFAMAYYKLSVANSWMFDESATRNAIEQAIRLSDRLPPASLDLVRAYSYYIQETYSRAIPLLESVLKQDPENKEALYVLSEIYMHSVRDRNPRLAAEIMKKLLALDPDFHLVYAHLGIADALDGDIQKSEELLDRWEMEEPEAIRADRVILAVVKNRLDEALQLSNNLPEFFFPGPMKARWAIGASRLDQARELLPSSLPNEGYIHYFGLCVSATIDCYNGRFESATRSLQQQPEVVSREGEGENLGIVGAGFRLMMELSALKGDLSTARAHRDRLVALMPESPTTIYSAALFTMQTGDLKTATEYLERLRRLKRVTRNCMTDTYIDALEGEILMAQGQNTAALPLLERAAGSGKAYAEFYSNGWMEAGSIRQALGRAYLAMGDDVKAAEAFDAFLNSGLLRVDHPILYMRTTAQLADLRLKAGDRASAQTLLKTYMELWGKADWNLAEIRDVRAKLNRVAQD